MHKDTVHIKICGMTRLSQVAALEAMGVDFAGFIFYEKSPRYVVPHINAKVLKEYKGHINKTGVFVNETYDSILRTAEQYGLDTVQLHGDETPDTCEKLSKQIKTIKAFRISGDETLDGLLNPYTASADMFLFDTKAKDYGGTGKKFDWGLLERTAIQKPYFLSGGIGPDDAPIVKDFIKNKTGNPPFSLDLNSKFETAPGVKDMIAVKDFVRQFF